MRPFAVRPPYTPAISTQARKEIRAWPEVGAREVCPKEAGSEEAVVEALVLRQGRGGLGLLRAHAEDAPRARAPEEHLEHQDVHVQECNEEDEEFRDDDHRATVYQERLAQTDADGLRLIALRSRAPQVTIG